MSVLTSKTFWADAAERAVKTIAQSLISLWVVGDIVFNLLVVNWEQALGVSLGAGVVSILFSIVSSGTGDSDSASLVVETTGPKK